MGEGLLPVVQICTTRLAAHTGRLPVSDCHTKHPPSRHHQARARRSAAWGMRSAWEAWSGGGDGMSGCNGPPGVIGDGQEVSCPTPYRAGTSYWRTRRQPPSSPCLAQSYCCRRKPCSCILPSKVCPSRSPVVRSLGRLGRGRKVLFVLVVLLVVLEVRIIEEPNRPDVTGADPPLPELVSSRTHRIAPGINRLTGRQQGEMPIPWLPIIREGG